MHSSRESSHLMRNVPARKPPQFSSLLPAPRHRTLLSNHASLPFPPPTDWKGAFASTHLPNPSTVTGLAITSSSVPSSLTTPGAPNNTPPGTTPAALPPVDQEAAYVDILDLYVSTAMVLMKQTLPPVPNAQPLTPVNRRRLTMRSKSCMLRGRVHLGDSFFSFLCFILCAIAMGRDTGPSFGGRRRCPLI
jgi:hypothetical protein